ncbi:MAG: hypothetical protein ACR2NP_19695 [Pirellulaceae bacterium]
MTDTTAGSTSTERAATLGTFLEFLLDARAALKSNLANKGHYDVEQIRAPLEEHYLDDQGKPAMYQRLESALYDDSQEMVTLWQFFERYDRDQLHAWHRLVQLDQEGLTTDRHPRKVFDRSPFGIVAIIVGTITVWMTILKTFSGEDASRWLEVIHFNWVAGSIWIIGLFVALWYILKTLRNNRQVAFLSSLNRALTLYLDHDISAHHSRSHAA